MCGCGWVGWWAGGRQAAAAGTRHARPRPALPCRLPGAASGKRGCTGFARVQSSICAGRSASPSPTFAGAAARDGGRDVERAGAWAWQRAAAAHLPHSLAALHKLCPVAPLGIDGVCQRHPVGVPAQTSAQRDGGARRWRWRRRSAQGWKAAGPPERNCALMPCALMHCIVANTNSPRVPSILRRLHLGAGRLFCERGQRRAAALGVHVRQC